MAAVSAPPPAAGHGDDFLAVRDQARVQGHDGHLNADLGSLAEHPQRVGHQFHRAHAAVLPG